MLENSPKHMKKNDHDDADDQDDDDFMDDGQGPFQVVTYKKNKN